MMKRPSGVNIPRSELKIRARKAICSHWTVNKTGNWVLLALFNGLQPSAKDQERGMFTQWGTVKPMRA